jgi:hypothetical protein
VAAVDLDGVAVVIVISVIVVLVLIVAVGPVTGVEAVKEGLGKVQAARQEDGGGQGEQDQGE